MTNPKEEEAKWEKKQRANEFLDELVEELVVKNGTVKALVVDIVVKPEK